MHTLTATQARARFGEMLDKVQRAPVRITRHRLPVAVMVSPEDYAAMHTFQAKRLARTLKDNAIEAEVKGLTEAELARLLADES